MGNRSPSGDLADALALGATALYAGFRLNEATGTSAVLASDSPVVAEIVLRTVNSHRYAVVGLLMTGALLFAGGRLVWLAVRHQAPWRCALLAAAVLLLAADGYVTLVQHLPDVRAVVSGTVPDWAQLRDRWIAHDHLRTAMLGAAVLLQLVALLVSPGGAAGAADQPTRR
jgi:hypothetical protein